MISLSPASLLLTHIRCRPDGHSDDVAIDKRPYRWKIVCILHWTSLLRCLVADVVVILSAVIPACDVTGFPRLHPNDFLHRSICPNSTTPTCWSAIRSWTEKSRTSGLRLFSIQNLVLDQVSDAVACRPDRTSGIWPRDRHVHVNDYHQIDNYTSCILLKSINIRSAVNDVKVLSS